MFDTIIAEMKNIRTLRKRRAVSPVIATVILVAVTITVAVAVSYWMSSIAGQYTGFEKVEIQSGYATKDPTGDFWTITIKLKNTGSAPSTINSCFVNERPIEEYIDIVDETTQVITWKYGVYNAAVPPVLIPTTILDDGVTLESGTSATIYVTIVKVGPTYDTGVTFTSGTTINVKLHSAGGMDYIRLIQLS